MTTKIQQEMHEVEDAQLVLELEDAVKALASGLTVAKPDQKTQLDRAFDAVGDLIENPIGVDGVMALRVVLDLAQNQPPEGAADGSIDEETYNALRKVFDDFRTLQKNLMSIARIAYNRTRKA